MKRREVNAPDVKYDPSVQVYGISLTEWDAMQKRLMVIEELLLANAEYDVNGAPLKKREPNLDPTPTDVIRTIKMVFQDAKIAFELNSINYTDNRAWTDFKYGTHSYSLLIEREPHV